MEHDGGVHSSVMIRSRSCMTAMQVGANHLGHFLLANLLLPAVESSKMGPRIVVTASEVCLNPLTKKDHFLLPGL